MTFKTYKTKIMPLCAVAIKQGQHEVHAPGHFDWGMVTCTNAACGEVFSIAYNLIFGSRLTDLQAAKAFETILAEDHKLGRKHQNSYELQD
jgi:hypothetical protein